jgi:hypothetical protein
MEGTTNPQLRDYCLEKLFSKVPEIKSLQGDLKEELEYALKAGFGAHIIYQDIFSYYILDLINKKDKTKADKGILSRSFELLEELVNDEDVEVRSVAAFSFIEPLLARLKPTKAIERYMLLKSFELAKEVGWNMYGFDYRVGWRVANEWHSPYTEYFGMIPNKPETKDAGLEEIYDKLYSREDKMPGGVAFMLTAQVRKNMESTLLPKAEVLLGEITERITDTEKKLSKSDFETAEVVMYNLRDAVKLAKDSKSALK